MYCPKCGQQQISDEVRFCSRCGFQLGVVTELIATDGVLQNYSLPQTGEKFSVYRQITSSIGAKMIFFSIVSVPFAVLLGIPFDTPIFLLLSALLFFVGFMQILYAQIFGKKDASANFRPNATKNLHAINSQMNLPAAVTEPILEIRNRHTSEIIPPPSVTDHTTKLLEQNPELSDRKN